MQQLNPKEHKMVILAEGSFGILGIKSSDGVGTLPYR